MANDRTVKGMKSSQGTVGVFWVYIILISCIFLEKLKDPLEMFGTLKSRWGRPCWLRLLAIFGLSVVVVVFGDQSNLRKEKVTWLTLAYHSPPGSEAMAGPQGRSLMQKAKREAADWLGLRDFLGMIFFYMNHWLSGSRAHSGPGTSITNQENALQTWLDSDSFSTEIASSQVTLVDEN